MVGGEGGDHAEPNGAVAAADRAGGAPDSLLGEEQEGGAGIGQDQGGAVSRPISLCAPALFAEYWTVFVFLAEC